MRLRKRSSRIFAASQVDEHSMLDTSKTVGDIAFQEPIRRRPFPANFPQGGMTAPAWSKAMTSFVEVGAMGAIVNAFEDHTNHLLHHLIPCRRDAQFPHFAIGFGNVDGANGPELKLFRSHLLYDLLDHLEGKAVDGFSIRSGSHISWG